MLPQVPYIVRGTRRPQFPNSFLSSLSQSNGASVYQSVFARCWNFIGYLIFTEPWAARKPPIVPL